MTSKEIILEQMASCHDKKNWFVPLKDALAGLNDEQAKQSIGSVNHSVWQIVNHLIFWNERWLIRYKGDVPTKMEGDNSGTLTGDSGGETEWQSSLQRLDSVLSELESRLKSTDDSVLNVGAFKGYESSWYKIFTQMTIHNAYQIRQIVTHRKQQGSRTPKQGVG